MSADKRRDWVRGFLDGDFSNVSFTTISDYLDELIQSPADFLKVLASVRYIDRHLVIEAVQPRLQDLLQSAYDLILTVQMVKPDKHALIFDQIQYDIGMWINSLSDLIMLLKWIDTGHSRVVIQPLRVRQLEELIERAYESELRTAYDKERPRASKHLLQVLQLVGDDNNRLVLEAVKASLDKWITSISDFNLILGFLPAKDKKWLLDLLWSDKRIERWVHSASDFSLVSKFLPSEFIKKLFEKYDRKMNEWIQSAADFNLVSKFLPTKFSIKLFEKYERKMNEWIQSAADFNLITEYLPSEHHAVLLEKIRPRVGELIQSAADFNLIMEYLPYESRAAAFAMVRPRLEELIHSAADLKHVTKFLLFNAGPETVFKIVKPRLGELIHTAADFVQVMKCYRYNKEIRKTVVEITGTGLGKIIRSVSDFEQVMKCLQYNREIQKAVVKIAGPGLGKMIRSASDFEYIMKCLSLDEEVRRAVFEMVGPGLVEVIHSASDFEQVMKCLCLYGLYSNEFRETVFKIVEPRLGELIDSAADFEQVMKRLPYNNEISEAAFEIIRPRLEAMIHSAADFKLITRHLTRNTTKMVFELIKPRLNDWIRCHSDLCDIYCTLAGTERQDLFERLSLDAVKLPKLIGGVDGLINLLNHTNQDEIISTLQSLKKISPSSFTYTENNLQYVLSLFHTNYWIELLVLFEDQPAAWVAPVFGAYCSPNFRYYPHTVTNEDKVRFLNSFWQKDPAIREAIISNPIFTRIMLNNIGDFSPKVRDSFRITAIKQRFQELSEGYKNLSSSRVHKIKKEVSDFLMQKTGELAEALIEKRCTDIRRLVQEIKQRIDEIRKDLRTQFMVFYGNPSRLGQVILDLQRLLNYPKPLFSKSSLTPLSIFSLGGAMSADDPAPEAEAEAKGPSSSAGGGGGGA